MPKEGAGTLALTADMKQMRPEFVRGVSLRGYGVSLALGVGVPIPILNEQVLKRTCVRDRDILAPVIDYSTDYPQKTGRVICHVNYEQLRSGEIEIDGKKIAVGVALVLPQGPGDRQPAGRRDPPGRVPALGAHPAAAEGHRDETPRD